MLFWIVYAVILFYMEIVFHLGCFGLQGGSPLFTVGLITLIASIQALIGGSQPKRRQKKVFWLIVLPEYLLFAVQAVYFKIFKQPLLLGAVFISGQDALGSYWRETLGGILRTLPLLFLLALPLLALAIFQKRKRWRPYPLRSIQKLRLFLGAWAALLYCACCMLIGSLLRADYSENYLEYYAPETVLRSMGVLTMVQRDGWHELQSLIARLPGQSAASSSPCPMSPSQMTAGMSSENAADQKAPGLPPTEVTEQSPDASPNAWDIDMEQLAALSQGNKETQWLADYIAGLTPTNRNEYTGMFKGYNLIFLTAEGFSTYAVREDLTPTLYRMVNSSFVFSNYYVPLWQTSTSDGEYVNCTGLIPDGQYSMLKSASNNMLCSLPKFFAGEGVYCRAYHNNTLSYYDRHLTHPNLGYDFKAAKPGKLSEAEWGDQLFPLITPDAWPASDYEMMLGTVPEYIHDDRFHVYYMKVSGHMN